MDKWFFLLTWYYPQLSDKTYANIQRSSSFPLFTESMHRLRLADVCPMYRSYIGKTEMQYGESTKRGKIIIMKIIHYSWPL